MKLLDNGSILLNGEEYAPDTISNMYWGECTACGWTTVNNGMWVHMSFQDHECLTKNGKPRKRKGEGFMRPATMMELYQDQMNDGVED